MSARPVIVLLLMALALAMVTFFVVRQPVGGASSSTALQPGDKLVAFAASDVRKIAVGAESITRGDDGRWTWTSAAGKSYGLDGQRVAAFLRLLADSRSMAAANAGETIPTEPAPVTLEITSGDAASTKLTFAARALGGRVLVQTPSGLTMASDELLRVLTSPGPSAWRPTKPLSEAVAAVSGVTIRSSRSGSEPMSVRRASGRWVVDAPVRAPADQAAVSRLIAALDGVEVARFADDVTPAQAGLEKPGDAVASFEIARTGGGNASGPATLLLGNPADATGASLFAMVSGGVANAGSVFVVDGVKLAGLRVDARDLIHKSLSTQQEADVAGLRISAGKGSVVRLMREGSAWTEQMGDPPFAAESKPIKLDPARSEATAAILSFLLTKTADAGTTSSGVDIRTEPSAPVIGSIALLEPMGNAIETIEILDAVTSPDRKSRYRTFRIGNVERSFAKVPGELERWLAELAR